MDKPSKETLEIPISLKKMTTVDLESTSYNDNLVCLDTTKNVISFIKFN